MGPKQSIKFSTFGMESSVMQDINKFPGVITIWGAAHYKDPLSGDEVRQTRYCYRLFNMRGGDTADFSPSNSIQVDFDLCPGKGNCADQSCSNNGYP
jgi:hypothetical protein